MPLELLMPSVFPRKHGTMLVRHQLLWSFGRSRHDEEPIFHYLCGLLDKKKQLLVISLVSVICECFFVATPRYRTGSATPFSIVFNLWHSLIIKIFDDTCWYLHIFAYMCLYVLICAYMCLYVLTCAYMRLYALICAYMCLYMLIFEDFPLLL